VAADAERRFSEKRREKQKRRGKNGKKKMTDAGGWAVNVRSLGEKVGPEKFSTSYFLGVEISRWCPGQSQQHILATFFLFFC
jgi:hypothetical protein